MLSCFRSLFLPYQVRGTLFLFWFNALHLSVFMLPSIFRFVFRQVGQDRGGYARENRQAMP